MYLVYIIYNGKQTYIGMTNNFLRRWRQHNGEIVGGARYTTSLGGEWYPILIIDGFESKREAMQCEWKLKRKRGVCGRILWAHELLTKHSRWTYRSPEIKSQGVTVYIDHEFSEYFKDYFTRELYWR
jgi:predicted GIY-YIG superfamily endonuclease